MPGVQSSHSPVHRVVWQITDGADAAERLLRSLANLLADLRADGVEIEVVAQAAGLDLLLADGTFAAEIADLRARGVAFLACENTLRGRGVAVEDLVPGAGTVSSGVGHLVRRQTQGWSYLHA